MRYYYLLFVAAFAVCSFATQLHAQNADWVIYPDMQYITDIAQEGDFLWVTSQGGVAKVNRHTLESTLLTKANAGLPYDGVEEVVVQGNSRKWFSTSRGGMLLDNGKWTAPVRFPVAFEDTAVWYRKYYGTGTLIRNDGQNIDTFDMSTIIRGADKIGNMYWDGSSMWVGSTCFLEDCTCKAIYRFTDGEWSSIPLPTGSNFISMHPIGHHNDTLWLSGTRRTLSSIETVAVRYDGISWTIFIVEDIGTSVDFSQMRVDSSGYVWLPTSSRDGIVQFNGTAWQPFDLSDTLLTDPINCLFADSDGSMWAGTRSQGLLHYKNNVWSHIHITNTKFVPITSLGRDLFSITVDTDQSLWVDYGAWSPHQHITHIVGENWNTDTKPYWYDFNGVDKAGIWWQGSSLGLWRLQNDSREKISDEHFKNLFIDRSNNLWLGTLEGIARYDHSEWNFYTVENSDFSSSCVAMTQGKDGTLWAAMTDQILTFDGTTWHLISTPYPPTTTEGMPRYVKAITADSIGSIWMRSSNNSEVFHFDGTVWTEYNTGNSTLPSGRVTSLITDRNGNVWIGMSTTDGSSALVRIDHATQEWSVLTPENSPLPYGTITCLAVDSSNNLWIGMAGYNKLIGYREGGVLVDVEEQTQVHVQNSTVYSFPNPAASHTTLRYTVPAANGVTPVRIQLFNALGVPVATLEDSQRTPGEYTVDVDVQHLATGTYYYRIMIGGAVQTQQLVVVK